MLHDFKTSCVPPRGSLLSKISHVPSKWFSAVTDKNPPTIQSFPHCKTVTCLSFTRCVLHCDKTRQAFETTREM